MKTKMNLMKPKLMSKLVICLLFLACLSLPAMQGFAQNGAAINTTGVDADPSAILDVSSTTQGVLVARMTEAQRNAISNPAVGLLIFNLDTKCFNVWTGTTWKQSCFDCDFNPPIPGNNGPLCEGSTLNLTATSIIGATYQWAGPNGFTSTQQNPSIPNATSAASGSYSVVATLNGCTSSPQSTVVTINATPVTPVAGNNGPGCVGGTLNLSASTIVGATYAWTGPNGYSSTDQNPVISNVQLTHGGTYNVVATVNGCASATGSTSVVVNATPVSTFTPTSGKINTAVAFSATTSGAAYSWTFPSGSPSSSTIQNPSVTWTTANTYNVSLTVTLNGCSSSTTTAVSITAPIVQTFNYTGGQQTFVVPSGVTSVIIDAYGAQGGSAGYTGGYGAYTKGTLAVTPGSTLTVVVGGQGSGTTGGYNGGGNGGVGSSTSGAGGGGASDIRQGGTALANRIMVAAGTGGSGGSTSYNATSGLGGAGSFCSSPNGYGGGGANGCELGANGGCTGGTNINYGSGGSGAGLSSGGGAGGNGTGGVPSPGTLGQGGYGGGSGGVNGGGGGGGGYYGGGGGQSGGGGCNGGGGGGSSYISTAFSNTTFTSDVRAGNGQVIITY